MGILKFQVGDVVRVKDCQVARDAGYVGAKGTIVFYRHRLYGVLFDRVLNLVMGYYSGELELVEKAE